MSTCQSLSDDVLNVSSDYKNDPYSQGDPCKSICCRNDLRESHASPEGCYDTKVSWPTLSAHQIEFSASLVSWPTLSANQLMRSLLLTLCCPLVRWRICSWLGGSWRRRWTVPPLKEDSPCSPGMPSTARHTRGFLSDTTSASSACSRSSSAPEDHGSSLSLKPVWALQSVQSAFILNAKLLSRHLTISPGMSTPLLIDGLREVNRNDLVRSVCLLLREPFSAA